MGVGQLGHYIQFGICLAMAGTAAFFIVSMWPEERIEIGGDVAGAGGGRREWNHWFLRIFGGVIIALSGFIAMLPLGKGREKLNKKLVQAGRPGKLSVDEYHAARIVVMGLMVLVGLYFDSEMDSTPAFALLMLGLGFGYPDIWLAGLTQKRRRRVFRDLPDILDLLRLAVDAGLDLGSAMKVVIERGRKGPLLDEFEAMEREMSLGRTRKEALRNFADRLMMTEINSFVLALIQADQLGASIGPILRVQSDVARTRRWQVAETLVNKMPMKMLGPLVVFIFPASFIILFTPLVIQYLHGTE